MDSKKLLLFVFIIFFSAVVSSSAHDTDLYMSSGEGVEPNILVIFDNSGSMNDLIQAYFYDPATTYPNERCFTCNPQTAIYNEIGSPVALDRLKLREWIYIEGVSDRGNRGNIARRIYILPGQIDEKEEHLYPFME